MNGWITGGPEQRTGHYRSADGTLHIRFDALMRSDRQIERRDLETGILSFRADHMLFVVFVEEGDLNPTRCIRFVQVKRGHVRLRDRARVREPARTGRNALLETWSIDDVDGDRQLGSSRRRDGQVSTSTCDTPSTEQPQPYQVSVDYHVDFILYVVNCCTRFEIRTEQRGQKKPKKLPTVAQVLFAVPWSLDIQGAVPFGGNPARASFRQTLEDVEVAPPDGSLTPVLEDVRSDPRICQRIRLRQGPSPCH